MKRLLLILSVLLCLSVDAQIGRYPLIRTVSTSSTPSYDPPTPDGTVFGWWVGSYTDSFTLDGSNVQAWADSLESGHDLEYYAVVATSTPTLSSGTVTFDGSDDELRTNNGLGYSMDLPVTYIAYMNQITWQSGDRLMSGRSTGAARLYQYDGSPELELYGGTQTAGIACTDLSTNTWAVVVVVFDGTDSFIQVNNGTKRTAIQTPGTIDPEGIYLAANPDHNNFANVAFKEIIAIEGIEDEANLTAWYNYLHNRYE